MRTQYQSSIASSARSAMFGGEAASLYRPSSSDAHLHPGAGKPRPNKVRARDLWAMLSAVGR